MRLRDELAGGASAIALGLAAVLAFSFLVPAGFIFPALAQLAPYVALALVAVAFPLALLRRWLRVALCILAGCAALGTIWARFEAMAADAAQTVSGEGGEVFTLVSFNALHSNTAAPSAVPYLLGSDADAILLLEAGELSASLPALMKTYPYKMGCDGKAKCDSVLLSKYPPTVAWKAGLGAVPAERYIQFGIDFRGRPLTLVGVHLSKPYFDDLALIELGVLAERVNRLTGPVIVAGDFNSAPWAPALGDFSRATGLAFSGAFVPTWPASAGAAGLPIDHVLARSAGILDLRAMPSAFGSNHRGLVARIFVPGSARGAPGAL